MPNILYALIRSAGFFILTIKGTILFAVPIFEFGKNANSIYVGTVIRAMHKVCLATVGVCVFRALASAGALFYLRGFRMKKRLCLIAASIISVLCLAFCLSACSTRVEFKVNFMVDGQIVHTINTNGSEIISMPPDPHKDGYVFDGWYLDKDVWGKPFTTNSLLNEPLSNNMTVYCKWRSEHEHTYTAKIVEDKYKASDASCKDKAQYYYSCECGEKGTQLFENGEFANHTPKAIIQENTTDSTCTAEGHYDEVVRCNACNEIISSTPKTIDKKPHSWETWTNTDVNYHTHKCSVCKTSETERHNIVNDICSDCGYCTDPATIKSISGGTVDNASKTAYILVDFATSRVNLSTAVITTDNASWKLYNADDTELPTKSITPNNGLNTYFIVVSEGKVDHTYELTVYKSYSVSIEYYDVYNTLIKKEIAFTGYEYNLTYIPDITGYTFNSWKNPIESVDKIIPYGDTKLYAGCTANTYTFDLDVNGGDELSENNISVTFDSYYTLPAPTRTGYIFLGWFDNSNRVESSGTSKFTADISLTAQWKIGQYVVSIEENIVAGRLSGSGNYDFGERVTVSATPYLGYVVSGWYNGENKVSDAAEFSFVLGAENISLTAIFEIASEMENFTFSSTETTCGITGMKDKTIEEIVIPNYVTSINQNALYDCGKLISITLPFIGECHDGTGNTYFGRIFGASSYSDNSERVPSSLKTVIITGGHKIDEQAFYGCKNLTSVTIPNSVTSIGNSAFAYCGSLANISIPNSVTSIGREAFRNCNNLTSITVEGGNSYYHSAGNCLIETTSKKLIAISPNSTIPEDGSVLSIDSYAFLGCDSLTAISIPNCITQIESHALFGCSNLTSLTIPFVGANKDGTINSHFGYIFGYARFATGTNYTQYIPNSLKTVIISASTSIGSESFRDCKMIANIIISDSVTNIGQMAFSGCSGLTSIEIPNSVLSIGNSAFSGCSSLTSVTIPNSVVNIEQAFYNCKGLTIYCEVASAPSGWDNNWNGGCPIVWNCKTNHKDVNGYEYTIISGIRYQLKDGIATVAVQPANISGNIILPEKIVHEKTNYIVTSIGWDAFEDCKNLESIALPDSVASIEGGAFRNCIGLISVVFTENSCLSSINNYAFSGCENLTSIILPSSVTEIGYCSFENCKGLTNITIMNNVKKIKDKAFVGCNKLTIYCELENKPVGWYENWNIDNRPVVWNYKNTDGE